MNPGGEIPIGRTGFRKICDPLSIVYKEDVNRDGYEDKIILHEFGPEDCVRPPVADRYIAFGGPELRGTAAFSIEGLPFEKKGYHYFYVSVSAFPRFAVGVEDGCAPLSFFDPVAVPPDDHAEGQFGYPVFFTFELDENMEQQRTFVLPLLTSGIHTHFELSALTLVQPREDLEPLARLTIAGYPDQDSLKERPGFLRRVSTWFFCNLGPFQCEDEMLDREIDMTRQTKLALGFEKNIAEMDLDPATRWLLLEKIGQLLSFEYPATVYLAWQTSGDKVKKTAGLACEPVD
ncbi:MAG: hypothetical protein HY466_07350 [Deltaproteobacteria bacterium]|nr:hypothetical protein [Deltaproteobacteria bacterium]